MDLDPSVRAAGMGAASNAVFWDEGVNHWGNPALLGYQRGLRYEWGKTQLVPGLSDHVFFRTNVVKLGAGGCALALSGEPFGALGGLRVDYGSSTATDDQGNPTVTFDSWEDVESWSFGLSLARLGEEIAVFLGHDPVTVSRLGDVSFGMSGKHWEVQLAPDATGRAETSAHDLGFLVRLSPLDWFEVTREGFVGLDLAYGWSNLSYDGEGVVFVNANQAVPPSEHEREGFAGRLRVDWPDFAGHMPGPEWIWEGLRPLLSVGLARDHSRIGIPASRYEADGDGVEVALANVFWLRRGNYEDKVGEIEDRTEGWSVGLPIGRVAGIRYDHARFPQARDSGIQDLSRNAVSAWVDPLEVWRLFR